jgi:hypothetical protein
MMTLPWVFGEGHAEAEARLLEAIRKQPGQEDYCLWLRKVKTESRFDYENGGTIYETWHRRCVEPRGHEGAHKVASFLIDRQKVGPILPEEAL